MSCSTLSMGSPGRQTVDEAKGRSVGRLATFFLFDSGVQARYCRCMGLEHFEWEVGDVTVLHLSGSITLGDGTRKFRKLIRDTLDAGKKNILLNMSEVVYLDSSGMGELVAAYTTSKNTGGTLKLRNLQQPVP